MYEMSWGWIETLSGLLDEKAQHIALPRTANTPLRCDRINLWGYGAVIFNWELEQKQVFLEQNAVNWSYSFMTT